MATLAATDFVQKRKRESEHRKKENAEELILLLQTEAAEKAKREKLKKDCAEANRNEQEAQELNWMEKEDEQRKRLWEKKTKEEAEQRAKKIAANTA